MSEPKRWMDEAPPEVIERLLEAATAERPPEASLSRALAALGLGAGATSAATTASAAAAGAATAGTATAGATAAGTTAGAAGVLSAGKATSVVVTTALVKWGLAGGALIAASLSGVAVMRHAAMPDGVEHAQVAGAAPSVAKMQPNVAGTPPNVAGTPPNVAASPPNVAASPRNGASPAPSVAPGAAHSSVRGAHRALLPPAAGPSAAAEPVDAEGLAEEVALVDRARGALSRGDARATLGVLDDYDARFSPRKFAPESLYLRMEALLRLGQTTEARAVAERLATRYPSSPNAARARQVLGAIP